MRGVKGVECQALTEEINKALGEVYESKPTQEMFEQEVQVNVDNEISVSESWSGSSTVRAATPSLCAACARHAPLIDASSHGRAFLRAPLRAQWGSGDSDSSGGGSQW